MKLIRLWGDQLVGDPCGCCGMTYVDKVEKRVMNSAGLGIRVLYGKHGTEQTKLAKTTGKETTTKHVETKNGVLTVITRTFPNGTR